MWNNYVIEEDWDFGFVEVSTDGGTTWTEQKVYDEGGTRGHHAGRLRRPERPDERLRRQEVRPDRQHRRLAARLRRPVGVRRARPCRCGCAYATDEAFEERGWFADDFSVTGGGATTWSDDVEGGDNGWTATGGTFVDTTGAGWTSSPAAPRSRRSTTWPSGATSTASTRA